MAHFCPPWWGRAESRARVRVSLPLVVFQGHGEGGVGGQASFSISVISRLILCLWGQ